MVELWLDIIFKVGFYGGMRLRWSSTSAFGCTNQILQTLISMISWWYDPCVLYPSDWGLCCQDSSTHLGILSIGV